MAVAWVLAAWAVQFRRELNAIAPARDTTSDGAVGDLAHAQGVSGHNPDDTAGVSAERSDADSIPEVRAIDVDVDLNVPGLTAAALVAWLIGRCRAGLERRLIYVIYNGVIWSASSGWQAREYTGTNPHDHHFHMSGHPDADTDGRPFGLAALVQEDDMGTVEKFTPDALAQVRDAIIWARYHNYEQYVDGKPTGEPASMLNTIMQGHAAARGSERNTGVLLTQFAKLTAAIAAIASGAADDATTAELRAVAARMEQLAEEDRQRDTAAAQAATEQLAALADLVQKAQSGGVAAEQIVDELLGRFAALAPPQQS